MSNEPTLRQKLHNAKYRLAEAAKDLRDAENAYDQAEIELNNLIDKVLPLSNPNGEKKS